MERSLQLGSSEGVAKLERNMNWLATTASVSPFIGLLGTVIGIIRAFEGLGAAGSTSLARRRAGHRRIADRDSGRVWPPPFRRRSSTTTSAPSSARSARAWTTSPLEFLNLAERSFGE